VKLSRNLDARVSAKSACLLLAVVTVGLAGPPPTGTIRGRISDDEGAAVSGAHIVVHWDASGAGVELKSNVGTVGMAWWFTAFAP